MPCCERGCKSTFVGDFTSSEENRYAPYYPIESVHIKCELDVQIPSKKLGAKVANNFAHLIPDHPYC